MPLVYKSQTSYNIGRIRLVFIWHLLRVNLVKPTRPQNWVLVLSGVLLKASDKYLIRQSHLDIGLPLKSVLFSDGDEGSHFSH